MGCLARLTLAHPFSFFSALSNKYPHLPHASITEIRKKHPHLQPPIMLKEIRTTTPRVPQEPPVLLRVPRPNQSAAHQDLPSAGPHTEASRNWSDLYVASASRELADSYVEKLKSMPDRSGPEAQQIYQHIETLRVPSLYELSGPKLWSAVAAEMPPDLGAREVERAFIISTLREAKYQGRILEAMSGYSSYFPARTNTSIVALDVSPEMLERYDHPDRLRIAACLENDRAAIVQRFHEHFDVVSVCFGWRYPKHIENVLRLFHDILKPGGKISFIENPAAGYSWDCNRSFDPSAWVSTVRACGFRNTRFSALEMSIYESNHKLAPQSYYHCEATKV
jgi:SAM-dependent methyltransferase